MTTTLATYLPSTFPGNSKCPICLEGVTPLSLLVTDKTPSLRQIAPAVVAHEGSGYLHPIHTLCINDYVRTALQQNSTVKCPSCKCGIDPTSVLSQREIADLQAQARLGSFSLPEINIKVMGLLTAAMCASFVAELVLTGGENPTITNNVMTTGVTFILTAFLGMNYANSARGQEVCLQMAIYFVGAWFCSGLALLMANLIQNTCLPHVTN